MTGEVHHLAAVGIEWMMKFCRERRQRVASVMGRRGARVEFGMFQGGAAMTVPHAPQVRCRTLEKKRAKTAGRSVSMLPTAIRSKYKRFPQFSQYQEKPSSSSAPRRRSTTIPTVPAGRCGECGISGGNKNSA